MVEVIGGVTYYTITEFAAILKVAQSTIERWLDEGKLAYWQIERRSPIRIPATELKRYLHPQQNI